MLWTQDYAIYEKYRDIHFWSYHPALPCPLAGVLGSLEPETYKMINKSILFPSRPLLGVAPRQCVELPAAASNQDPDCLERVELNTTLAMKAELQSLQVYTVFQKNHHRDDYQLAYCWLSGNLYAVLQGSQFNSQKAIQEILKRSERTKNLINTRATEGNSQTHRVLITCLLAPCHHKGHRCPLSNQINLIYMPKSQWHCLNGLYNLYNEQYPLSLDPWFEWGKTCHVYDGKEQGEQWRMPAAPCT